MWTPREIVVLAFPNVRLYNLAFEIMRLAKCWKVTDKIKMGQYRKGTT